jgi:hypothetical protein
MSYGPLVRAAMGPSGLWRYPGDGEQDRESLSDAVTIYPDHVAARIDELVADVVDIVDTLILEGGR